MTTPESALLLGLVRYQWSCPRCHVLLNTADADLIPRCPSGCMSPHELHGVHMQPWTPDVPLLDPPHVEAFRAESLPLQIWLTETATELLLEWHNAALGKSAFRDATEVLIEMGRLAYRRAMDPRADGIPTSGAAARTRLILE